MDPDDSQRSRRRVLSTGLGLVAAMLGIGRAWSAAESPVHGTMPAGTVVQPPALPAESAPLVDPEIRQSVNGQLATTLRIRYGYQNIGGYKLHVRTYDGLTPGPTLRVRAGDVLR